MKQIMKNALLFTLLLTLFVVGCGGGETSPAQTDGIQATIEMTPNKPAVNEETQFRVKITGPEQDAPLDKAQVTMFLEMKEMDHGENRIALTETEPGTYTGKGTFPMAGVWVAHIRTEKNGQTHTSNVDLKVQ